MKPIVVIPAYNEQEHIAGVVRSAKQYETQIIVVDDASQDDTQAIAKALAPSLFIILSILGKPAP